MQKIFIFSFQYVNINELQCTNNHKKWNTYRVISFLLLYARTIIPESKYIRMRMHPISSTVTGIWYMVKGKNILKSDELKHSIQRYIIHINRSTIRMGQINNLNRSMKSMDFFSHPFVYTTMSLSNITLKFIERNGRLLIVFISLD